MDREWDLLRWEGGDECATAVDLFGEGAKVLSTYAFKEYVVRLPTNWQTMNATLSQNMRRKVRTVYALLEKAALPWRMDVVCDKARLEDEMHHFIDLYFKRAETTDAHVTARTNKLQHAAVRAFVLDFVYGMARTGGALLFYLTVDGKRVASQLAYRLGDELYLSYSAFDPAWAAFSAMTTLTIEIFKWSFAQGLRLVNLSTGTDLGKLRWRPTENDLHIATVYSGSLRAATLSVAYNVIRKANSHASGTTVEK